MSLALFKSTYVLVQKFDQYNCVNGVITGRPTAKQGDTPDNGDNNIMCMALMKQIVIYAFALTCKRNVPKLELFYNC